MPALQFIALAGAFWVSLTRIKDYAHHPGDVLAGALIGIVSQVIKTKLFKKKLLIPIETL